MQPVTGNGTSAFGVITESQYFSRGTDMKKKILAAACSPRSLAFGLSLAALLAAPAAFAQATSAETKPAAKTEPRPSNKEVNAVRNP